MKENLSQEEYQHLNDVFNIVQGGIKSMLKVMKDNYIDYNYKYNGLLEHQDLAQALSACSEQLPQEMLNHIDKWLPCNNLLSLGKNDNGYGLIYNTKLLLPIRDHSDFYGTQYQDRYLDTLIPCYDVYQQLKDVVHKNVLTELNDSLKQLRSNLYKESLRYYEFSNQDVTKDTLLDNQIILNTLIHATNANSLNTYDNKGLLQQIINSSDIEQQNSLLTACNQLIHNQQEAKISIIEHILSQEMFYYPQVFHSFSEHTVRPVLEEEHIDKIFSNMVSNYMNNQKDHQVTTDNFLQK